MDRLGFKGCNMDELEIVVANMLKKDRAVIRMLTVAVEKENWEHVKKVIIALQDGIAGIAGTGLN